LGEVDQAFVDSEAAVECHVAAIEFEACLAAGHDAAVDAAEQQELVGRQGELRGGYFA